MKDKLIFPSSGFPEPVMGSIPFPRYAEWICQQLLDLYNQGKLDELRERERPELNGTPFRFRPDFRTQ
ncbi:MAG: hypothetical protein H7A51_09695 [Akkermansiaceae bacterium]|nr:hypothetical protein [Akkermansiaceae bacterium]